MLESLSAFCRMVSFTATRTKQMFVVSITCIRLRICMVTWVKQRNTEAWHILWID